MTQFVSDTTTSATASSAATTGTSLPTAIWDDSALGSHRTHTALGTPLVGPWPGLDIIVLGLGCYWAAEKLFWPVKGVEVTAAGWVTGADGRSRNEGVALAYDPAVVSLEELLAEFFLNHDAAPGPGNTGGHYRSAIYLIDESQREVAQAAVEREAAHLGLPKLGTAITPLSEFKYVAGSEQQYLAGR